MAIEVPPSRVPPGGQSPRRALAVALVALLAVVGFALAGKVPAAPAPRFSPPAALAAPAATRALTPLPTAVPTASPRVEEAATNALPAPTCVIPETAALGASIARHPRALAPTGLATLTPWGGADSPLVADTRDGFWALGSGRLSRLDDDGTPTASWTFADDELFASGGMAAARAGGVWLYGGPCIAWFDGQRFRDVIAAPLPLSSSAWVVTVAEAADGSLWAVTGESVTSSDGAPSSVDRVFHWDGRSWQELRHGSTINQPSSLTIDARGRVWVGPADAEGNLTSFDGKTWSTLPPGVAWGTGYVALVAAADGTLWSLADGLAHFTGTSWTRVPSPGVDLTGTVALAVGPDGTVWAVTGSVTLPGETDPNTGVAVARYDGHAWTVYRAAQGLPAPQPGNWATITAIAASRSSVVAATRDGFYRLAGQRWLRVGPSPALPGLSLWPESLQAVSADEAWVGTWDAGLWHVQGGVWTSVPVAGWVPPLRISGLARSPQGALAVASDHGAAVLEHGQWTVLEQGDARAVAFGRDGAIWVVSLSGEPSITSFRFDGRVWVPTAYPSLATLGGMFGIILGPDGEPWVGSAGFVGSLDRFDGAHWVHESPLGGSGMVNVSRLLTAPNGDVWVALFLPQDGAPSWALARYDGNAWTLYRPSHGPAQTGSIWGLALAPDGRLWAATDRGLATLDGQQWSQRSPGQSFYGLAFAPDGTLWAVGPSGVQRLPAGRLVGSEVSVP